MMKMKTLHYHLVLEVFVVFVPGVLVLVTPLVMLSPMAGRGVSQWLQSVVPVMSMVVA
jgi:hypothetical protein